MEHSGVGFDDPTYVDPLTAILNDLAQELDGDPSTFQELLQRSQPILGPGKIANINNASDYFTCVQNNYDILDMVDHLFNLMELLEYHTAMGTNRVSDQLNRYKQDLLQYREMLRMKGIDTDKNFVGRIDVLKQIYDVLADEYHPCRGVCICGLGGMGKTSLANEVCYQLLNSKASWKIIRIDLRERDSLLDLLSLTLGELQETFSSTDIKDMENKIWKAVENIKRRTILFYDNIDGLLQSKNNRSIRHARIGKGCDRHFPAETQVKILITSRQKLIPEEKLKEGMRKISSSKNRLGDLLLEIELGPLDVSEAVDLYLKCVDEQHRQKSKIVGEIVQYCALCPLAIRSTCSAIRSGLIEPQVIRYNLKIASEKGGLTNALQVNNCLTETFNSLKEDYQKKLIRLTVFKTAKFDNQAASMVLGETTGTMAHTFNNLLAMKTRHFVEIVDANEYLQKVKGSSTIDDVHVKRQLRYSLHPLVYMFLQEVVKDGKFNEEIKLAKRGFVQHFEDLLLKIGIQMDKNCMKAWKMIEENRKHLISLFLDDSIDTRPCDDMKKRILLCTQKVLIGNLLMGDFQRVNFIDRMIRNSKVNGNQLEWMFWNIARATWLYDLDRNELVIRQLTEVENMMNDVVGKSVAMAPVFGCFYYLKAKLFLRKRQPEVALEHIFMAHKLFNEHRFVRHNYLYHITTIYEQIGQAYMMFEPPDLKNALLYFSAAFVKASEDKVENFNNLDIPRSIASIGRCWYHQGLQEKANGNKIVAKSLLQKSVAYYTKAMAFDTQMNLHKIDNYAEKLTKRAESYVELGLLKVSGALSDAVKDIKEADMLREKILQPPSYKSTHTPHLVGKILLIKAKQEYENKQKSTAINTLREGVLYYEITRDMIKRGGLHPLQLHMKEYQQIIQKHLWALQQTRDVDKIQEAIKFYNDLNAGKFAEDMKRARSEKETKKNSEYIPIEDVVAEIMMSGPGQLTVAPTTEETEVEEEDFDNETMEKIALEDYELKPGDRMNFDELLRIDDLDHPDLHPVSDEEVSNADDESMEVTGAGNGLDITADMGKIISKSYMGEITEGNHDEVYNPENESKDETGNELLSTVWRKSSESTRLSSSDAEPSIKAKRREFRCKRGSRDASMQKFLNDLDELTSKKARGILKSSKSASKDYLTIVDTTDKEEKKDMLKKMKQIYSSVQEEQEEDIAEDDETVPSYQEDKVITGKKRHGVESESTEEASHAKSSRDVN